MEKEVLLGKLLEACNDGRRKSFFALAVNLLDLEALGPVREYLAQLPDCSVKERAAQVSSLLQEAAARKGISLTLRKKPKK